MTHKALRKFVLKSYELLNFKGFVYFHNRRLVFLVSILKQQLVPFHITV